MAKRFDGEIITEIQTIALSTLADQAAIKFTQLVLTEDFRILKSEIFAFWAEANDDDNMTGLMFGIANNELTVSEIAEAITAQGPLDRNDRGKHEHTGRWVKVLSQGITLPQGPNNAQTGIQGIFPGEGGAPMITSKDRWTYSDPEGWCFFIFNNTGSAMLTGTKCRLSAKHFGVWVS